DLDLQPKNLAEIEAEFEAKKSHLKALEQRFKQLQIERMGLDLELKEMDEQVARGNAQLMQLKTNKEYSAKITEIEGIKADKSVLEDKILAMMEEIETIQKQMAEEKEKLSADEQVFVEHKKRIETETQAIEQKIEELKKGRGAINAGLDANTLAQYERILGKKQGLAIVPVLKGNKCGGCYMNLTQQKANEIRAYKELIHCENCVRIIYLEEDLI
ncbi:MAG: hypothetical protein COW13_03995, partial [Candidatus Omnitrophica bacterium CG12_big_fil_rev_8_21_14_0_65_50_5]